MIINKNDPFSKISSLVGAPESRLHFGQLGEDCLIWHIFGKTRGGFYVDVGCYNPFRYSNTYLLNSQLGWTGINIDADERAIALFNKYRPNDINIHAGVGLTEETRAFTVFKEGAVNTFSPEIAARQQRRVEVEKTIQLPIRRLENILSERLPKGQAIDYMNVDCEGLDEEVLRSNDWQRFRPSLISVEIHGLDLNDTSKNPTVNLMRECGYKMIAHYFVTAFFQRIEA